MDENENVSGSSADENDMDSATTEPKELAAMASSSASPQTNNARSPRRHLSNGETAPKSLYTSTQESHASKVPETIVRDGPTCGPNPPPYFDQNRRSNALNENPANNNVNVETIGANATHREIRIENSTIGNLSADTHTYNITYKERDRITNTYNITSPETITLQLPQSSENVNINATDEACAKLQDELRSIAEGESGKLNLPVDLDTSIKFVKLEITTSLNDDYDNLDHAGHYNRREDLLQMFDSQGNVLLDEVFDEALKRAREDAAKNSNNKEAENVLIKHGNIVGVVGQAGIGKTTLTKLLTTRILEKRILPDTKYLFYILFRNVDFTEKSALLDFLVTSNKISNWIHDEKKEEKIMQKLNQEDRHIVMILDGLDEASENMSSGRAKPTTLQKKCKPEQFLKNILSGHFFPNAKKFITSRPRQMYNLHKDHRPHFILNVLGLSQDAQKELCRQICRENSDEVLDYLEKHPDLSAYCYVPVNCILTMFCINKSLKEEQTASLRSVTGIMVFALDRYMRSEHIRGDLENIKKLISLAWNGILDQKIMFTDKDLKKAGIDEATVSNFLETKLDSDCKLKIFEGDKRNYFSHLVWQEFFSAVNLILYMSYQKFQKHVSKFGESRFEVIIKLVYGLCNLEIQKKLETILSANVLQFKSKISLLQKFALDKIPKAITDSKTTEKFLRVCEWIKEADLDDLTEAVTSVPATEIQLKGTIYPTDVTCFHYFIRKSTRNFTLDVGPRINFVGDSCKRFFIEMNETLENENLQLKTIRVEGRDETTDEEIDAICKCLQNVQELTLWSCKVSGEQVKSISEAIGKQEQPLHKLNLSDNKDIRDEGAEHLSHCLDNVETLHIDDCGITNKGLQHLAASVAELDVQMEEIRLPGNNINDPNDIGAQYLSKCIHKIKKLNIQKCGITASGIKLILDALIDKDHHLEELHLRENVIGNDGAKYIAGCIDRISFLGIQKCNITADGIRAIAYAVKDRPKPINTLDIDGNSVGDEGGKALSECLFNLKHLQLVGCGIGQKGVKALRTACRRLPDPKPKVGGLDQQDINM
ncbi:unnamed protein product [Clavelina lepadiformis]|uniref:NACHT domain-containing protein n=1 Tax=Clavelina lepadiformis TaxID=159417 RepID=A0ABP0GKY5_CLALP